MTLEAGESRDRGDLTVTGRRDDTNAWNMALGGENSGSQCQQLWFPVGLIGSTAVQQQGDLPRGLGDHRRAQRPARRRSQSSFCRAVVLDKSLNLRPHRLPAVGIHLCTLLKCLKSYREEVPSKQGDLGVCPLWLMLPGGCADFFHPTYDL